MQVVMWVKGSGLPERHVQVYLHTVIQIQGIQRRGDGKYCAPLPPKEWGGEVGVPCNLFLDLGLGEVLLLGRLELAFGENRRRFFFRLVSPAEWAGALAPARLIHCMRALEWTDTLA